MRGEQAAARQISCIFLGSPPLARGTVVNVGGLCDNGGITPACAGNRTATPITPGIARDHPRLRGEQRMLGGRDPQQMGSPPLARGTVCVDILKPLQIGITPACAGNSLRGILLCG